MIFVTVGTHEQQFDRLIECIDNLVLNKIISEKVFMQIGFSSYVPKHCEYKKLINYQEMVQKVEEARIVICHGGPGTIMLSLSKGKIPIVVPRNSKYGEHVDDHQVLFSKRLYSEGKVISVFDIKELAQTLSNYNKDIKKIKSYSSNNNLQSFVEKFEQIALKLVE